MIDYEAAQSALIAALDDYASPISFSIGDAAHRIVDAALGGALYRIADDCQITKSHSLGEHGKPCLECGAEQIWVLPATKEKQ